MDSPFISVVIPAFNEESNIDRVLQEVHEVLSRAGFPYEVVVVDDGSTDRTCEVARRYDIDLVSNSKNLGKGGALKAGLSQARGQVVVVMDADGSHRAEDIPELIDPVLNGEAHVTVGSRFKTSEGKNSTSRLHLIGNRIINTLILLLTRRYISDSQSGFRAFKRDTLIKMPISCSEYEVETEMTIRMLKSGCKIKEVPIRCKQREKGFSKIDSFRDGFKILKAVLKTYFCD